MKPTNKPNFIVAIFFSLGLLTGCNILVAANQIAAVDHMEVYK